VPVLVQGEDAQAEQLPDMLKELAYRNGVELTMRWDSDVDVLAAAGTTRDQIRSAQALGLGWMSGEMHRGGGVEPAGSRRRGLVLASGGSAADDVAVPAAEAQAAPAEASQLRRAANPAEADQLPPGRSQLPPRQTSSRGRALKSVSDAVRQLTG
jgi:hypothetical protein